MAQVDGGAELGDGTVQASPRSEEPPVLAAGDRVSDAHNWYPPANTPPPPPPPLLIPLSTTIIIQEEIHVHVYLVGSHVTGLYIVEP